MSIASSLSALAESLSTLLSAINTKLTSKGVSVGADTLAEVPDKINAIVTGTGPDTSDATATAADIVSGKTAWVNGQKITGTLPGTARTSSDLTVSGKTVTAPAGIYASPASESVSTATQATPSISFNTSTGVVTASATQSAGYVSYGTKSSTYPLPTFAGTTITPTINPQVIAAGRYMTGAIGVEGDSNLVPANIKDGVTIFGVQGSYSGGGVSLGSDYSSTLATVASRTFKFTADSDNCIGVYVHHRSYNSSGLSGMVQDFLVLKDSGGTTHVFVSFFGGESVRGTSSQSTPYVTKSGRNWTLVADAGGAVNSKWFDTTSGAYNYTEITA